MPLPLIPLAAGAFLILESATRRRRIEARDAVKPVPRAPAKGSKGTLRVAVPFRVSGLEKTLKADTDFVKGVVRKWLPTIVKQLPRRCPGAPKRVKGKVRFVVKNVGGGFVVTVFMPSRFAGGQLGPVRDVVADCVAAVVKDAARKERGRIGKLLVDRTS